MMTKVTRRKVSFYGGQDEPSIDIDIRVYGQRKLMQSEVDEAGDILADRAMLAISDCKYIRAPLSRIKAERKRWS